jgi:hypothetical protein
MTTPDLKQLDAMIAALAPAKSSGETGAGQWADIPLIGEEALYGVIGEYVRAVVQDSEASTAGVLASVITTIGAMLGRGPFCLIEGAPHHARFMTLLVGVSSVGRKGVAMYHGVDRVIGAIDPGFWAQVMSGLSSGEGLIERVRDAALDGEGPRGKADPGVTDKRLLIKQGEAAGLFKVLEREGNTLSARIREAWDGDRMQIASRASAMIATDPHICIVAAITPTEFRRSLKAVEITNGLANRFMPFFCEREQELPFGGGAPGPWLIGTMEELKLAVERGRDIGLVTWSACGREWWQRHYSELTAPRASGALGTLLARGAPIVQRLALLFAVLDGVDQRTAAHCEAAYAIWKYIESTWRALYAAGSVLSDRSQALLAILDNGGAEGVAKSACRTQLGSGNISAEEVNALLGELREAGLARPHRRSGRGRPAEIWVSVRFLSPNGRYGQEG